MEEQTGLGNQDRELGKGTAAENKTGNGGTAGRLNRPAQFNVPIVGGGDASSRVPIITC